MTLVRARHRPTGDQHRGRRPWTGGLDVVSRRRAGRRRGHRPRSPAADDALDVAGRAVLPGFVDSHTHLVFGGDRADEFAARMAGAPYAAGGIVTTIEATRALDDDALAAATAARVGRAAPRRRHHVRDQVRLRRHRRRRGPGPAPSPGASRAETTFLGAHVVPPEFAGRADDYVALVAGPMLAACAPHARWADAFCEVGAFDADQCRAVLDAGRRRRARAAAPRQPARTRSRRRPGRRARLRVGRPLHVPHRRRRRRAGRERHGGDVPAGHRLLDPPALPRRPPRHRRRRHRGAGDELQPRVELHDVDVVRHRAGRARPADDDGRGGRRGDDRRRPRRCAATTSAGSVPAPAPTSSCSTPRARPTSSTGRACP